MKTNLLYRWGLGAVVGVALATPAWAQTSGLSGVKVQSAEFNGAIPRDVLDDLFTRPAVPAIHDVPPEDPVEARVGLATMGTQILQPSPAVIAAPKGGPTIVPPAPRTSPAASRIPPYVPQITPHIPQVPAQTARIAQQIPVTVPAAVPLAPPAVPPAQAAAAQHIPSIPASQPAAVAPAAPLVSQAQPPAPPAATATPAPRFEEPLQPLLPEAPVAPPVPQAVSQNLHLTSHMQSAAAPTPAAAPAYNEPVGTSVVDPSQNMIERQPRFPNFATLRTYQIEQAAPEQIVPPAAAPGGAIVDKDGVYLGGDPLMASACGDYDHCGCTWIFGLEATFLVPVRDGLDASIVLANQDEVFRSSGDNNMEFGPRLWFGIQHGCWQFRGRFWSLNGVEDDTNPLLLGTGDTIGLANGSFVNATTVDAEALRLFCCAHDWNFYAGFGFRYAKLHDVANLSGTIIDEQALTGIVQAQAIATHEIDGCGFTIPVGGFKPLHRFCCSTLDCFWNMRASFVWGDIDSSAQTSVQVFDPNGIVPGAASRLDAASATTNDEMFIGEVQLGLRWTHHLQCAPAIASMWVAFEGQWWDCDGGFALAESAAVVNSLGGGAEASSGPNIEMQMIGFALGAGLNW